MNKTEFKKIKKRIGLTNPELCICLDVKKDTLKGYVKGNPIPEHRMIRMREIEEAMEKLRKRK